METDVIATELIDLASTAKSKKAMMRVLLGQMAVDLPADQAYFFVQLAEAIGRRGYFRQQYWAFEEAIQLYERAEMPYEVFASRVNMALCLDHLSLYKFAAQTLRVAIRRLEVDWKPDWPVSKEALKATAWHNLATITLNWGKIPQAIRYNKKALVLRQNLGDEAGQVKILIGMANAHRNQGLYREAESLYRQAQLLTVQYQDESSYGKCALGLGNLYMIILDYDAAIQSFTESLACNQQNNWWEDRRTTLMSLGNACYQRLLKQILPGENLSNESRQVLLTILNYYKQALTATPTDDPISTADILESLAHLSLDLSLINQAETCYKQAEMCYKHALDTVKFNEDYHNCFGAMMGLGEIAIQRRLLSKSLDWYKKALILSQKYQHVVDENRVLLQIGYLHWENKKPKKAIPFLKESIRLSEQLGKNLIAETKKIGYFSAIQTDYELLIQAYMATGSSSEALFYLEKSKSKTLLDMLVTGQITVQKRPVAFSLLNIEQKYLSQLRVLMNDSQATISVKPLLKKLDQLYGQLANLSPEYVAIRRGESLSFPQIKTLLNA